MCQDHRGRTTAAARGKSCASSVGRRFTRTNRGSAHIYDRQRLELEYRSAGREPSCSDVHHMHAYLYDRICWRPLVSEFWYLERRVSLSESWNVHRQYPLCET